MSSSAPLFAPARRVLGSVCLECEEGGRNGRGDAAKGAEHGMCAMMGVNVTKNTRETVRPAAHPLRTAGRDGQLRSSLVPSRRCRRSPCMAATRRFDPTRLWRAGGDAVLRRRPVGPGSSFLIIRHTCEERMERGRISVSCRNGLPRDIGREREERERVFRFQCIKERAP